MKTCILTTLSFTLLFSAFAMAAPPDTPTSGDFQNLGLAYQGYYQANQKGPSKADDLVRYLQDDQRLLGFLKTGKIAFINGIGKGDLPDGESATVIAFEKSIATVEGLVLMADGSVRKMTPDQFKVANIAKEREFDEACKRNLQAILWAVMRYGEDKKFQLPPAAVPNDKLAPGKRLSGFVLLLPHLGARPSFIPDSDPNWKKWSAFYEEQNKAAKQLFAKIDLQKGWDDPANAVAAKSVVPFFVIPSGAPDRTEVGYGVSHFAFVRGSAKSGNGPDDGPFPLVGAKAVDVPGITDGTSRTLGVGQVNDELGPWIAAGPSTSRRLFHPSEPAPEPAFGSRYKGCAYFATSDGFSFFMDMGRSNKAIVDGLPTRAGGEAGESTDYFRFQSVAEWKKAIK